MGTEQIGSGAVEANGTIGKAMRYIGSHHAALMRFLSVPGAPLDDNVVGRLSEPVVRSRRDSPFHRSEIGVGVSDMIVSVLATCRENDVEGFDHLVALQRRREGVRHLPESWLSWNHDGDCRAERHHRSDNRHGMTRSRRHLRRPGTHHLPETNSWTFGRRNARFSALSHFEPHAKSSVFEPENSGMAKAIHSMIRVRDEQLSVEFYRQAFELNVADRLDFDSFTLVYLSTAESGFELELTVNKDRTESYDLGDGYGHFAVSVDDVVAEHQRFESLGLSPRKLVEFERDGELFAKFFFVQDPDGYEIEVLQRHGRFQ